jgi:hypothetical protein
MLPGALDLQILGELQGHVDCAGPQRGQNQVADEDVQGLTRGCLQLGGRLPGKFLFRAAWHVLS